LEASIIEVDINRPHRPRTGRIVNHAPAPYSQKWLTDMKTLCSYV